MSRAARLTVTEKSSWYFLHTKTKPTIKRGALNEKECGAKLLSIISEYSQTFECDLAGIFISRFHYALVVKFQKFKVLPAKVLLQKATKLYEGKQERYDLWSKIDWADFNKRLFDVAEFMRSIQMLFARWHNKKFNRKGKSLWAERFKSSILTNDFAALDAMLYVESGPLREKDAASLNYPFSSYALRASNVKWLMPIEGQLGFAKGAKGKADYQQMLNHRVKLPTKDSAIVAQEIKNGYKAGCYLKRQPYFLDGLIIGSEKEIQTWKNILRAEGRYIRKSRPNKIAIGNQYSIREQRSHAVVYR